MTNESMQRLSKVDPSERVLLLSHCLRPSQSCPGKFDKKGLKCPEDCSEDCSVGRLRKAAVASGYKGVCVAAGGAMALRFVKEQNPGGIVAVACDRELVEGVDAIKGLAGGAELPPIAIIPLCADGCVDTEVDERAVTTAIRAGCSAGD